MGKREQSAAAVKKAGEKWAGAPLHFKAMASAYVEPLLKALEAHEAELEELQDKLIKGEL